MTSLEAYCQRLKDLSSQLNDVECLVNENRLVVQLGRGLTFEFDTVAAYINQPYLHGIPPASCYNLRTSAKVPRTTTRLWRLLPSLS